MPKSAKVTAQSPLLGAHMSISGGPANALERGQSIGCTAIQIFTKNNMQWTARPFTPEELGAYRAVTERPRFVFGHSSYLINLAAPASDLLEKSIASLRTELERADALQLPFLVLHPGAHAGAGEEEGIRRVIVALDRVFGESSRVKCRVALESTAGQGSSLGCRFEHLAAILDGVRSAKRLAVCLDTAHLFASGYDISTLPGFKKTMAEFDRIVGLQHLVAWHLNDSKTRLGSRVDRHEHLGQGKIGLVPFKAIVRAREFAHLPKVLETPKEKDLKEDVINLGVLRGFLKG